MTDKKNDEDDEDDDYDKYHGSCPDKRHKDFELGARRIVDIASGSDGERRKILPPSKVKRELEQLRNSLHNLSLEAQSSLWVMGAKGSCYSPSSDLLGRIELALRDIKEGRPKTDEVRHYLGTHAASLWKAHDGDIKDAEFVNFLETLIEDAGFGGEGRVRIDCVALAAQIRTEYANCEPPHWNSRKRLSASKNELPKTGSS